MNITVAIPCYNGAKFIGGCIESVLSMNTIPDSVIVVDDGSEDESSAIINNYPVTCIQHKQNLGLSSARNTALATAKTDIILFIDADTKADKFLLDQILVCFLQHKITGVGGRGIEVNRNSIYDEWRHYHASQGHGNMPKKNVEHLFGLCMAYQRHALLEIGGFDVSLRSNAEDIEVGYRLVDAGHNLFYLPSAIVYHQRTDTKESLYRSMYQWYYWAFIVKQKHGRNPWRLMGGVMKRLLFKEPWEDIFINHNFRLLRLDIEINYIKTKAIFTAAKNNNLFKSK